MEPEIKTEDDMHVDASEFQPVEESLSAMQLEQPQGTGLDERDMPVHELMGVFYQRIFPYKTYYHWLNYDTVPTKSFTNREFSFNLPNDVYVRYQSFNSHEELKAELLKELPSKIDIGAVYTIKPKEKKTTRPGAFVPVEKELVFDIDMTDYDEIRKCCSGGNVCIKCWQFMTVAIKILDRALRDDFGFKYLLWVYSGRRGVHCWICDERARKLSNEARSAIIAYLSVIKGGAQQAKKVFLPKALHPSLQRSADILRSYFPQIVLKDQDLLNDDEGWKKILQCIPDEETRKTLSDAWNADPSRTSTDKWTDLVSELDSAIGTLKKNPKRADALKNVELEIMFQYTYPRLDENVSTHINHLLKRRVCVPIDPEKCENFDPHEVPTVADLLCELNKYSGNVPVKEEGERKLHDYEKTSLKPYIKYFENFVQGIFREVRNKKRAASINDMEF
ncbi:4992_t:CDS:10 [Paraglomus occultum]|uniref:DNA primase n=1 Tax=Paraglomus occultum TaxID=144539 RepID=A0A9N9FTE3_9GLOM|nr:4992_t:CDS:10 [Paraglomus occultum]